MQLVPSVCTVLQENPQTPERAARGPSYLTTLHKFDAHASGRLPVQEKSLVPSRRVTPPYRRVMASGQPAITCEMALAQAELPHCRHQSSVELAPDLRGRTYQNPAPDAVADSVSARNRETNLTAECFSELATGISSQSRAPQKNDPPARPEDPMVLSPFAVVRRSTPLRWPCRSGSWSRPARPSFPPEEQAWPGSDEPG